MLEGSVSDFARIFCRRVGFGRYYFCPNAIASGWVLTIPLNHPLLSFWRRYSRLPLASSSRLLALTLAVSSERVTSV